ncbi:hypothetical protein Tco_0086039 [Tanacetum coccineum]
MVDIRCRVKKHVFDQLENKEIVVVDKEDDNDDDIDDEEDEANWFSKTDQMRLFSNVFNAGKNDKNAQPYRKEAKDESVKIVNDKTILAGDLEMQMQVTNVEMPKYKKQMDRFGKELAISTCEVNNEKYDTANLVGSFWCANPTLEKDCNVDPFFLLTVVLTGCVERIGARLKGNMAQEWIVECDGDEEVEVQDQQDQEAHWEVIGEAMEADEYLQPRQSSRTPTKTTQRDLFDGEFESGSEETTQVSI